MKHNKNCQCFQYNRIWHNHKKYQVAYCGSCNVIRAFHWKSFWRRFKCLFINETLNEHTTH